MKEEKLREAFRFYDKDGSGAISCDEIKEVFGVGKQVDANIWEQIMKECDQDGDGEIDFEEFKCMMHRLLT